MPGGKLLMIPGPTEFTEEVYTAIAQPTLSHVAPAFIKAHGDVLRKVRQAYCSKVGQPLVVGGNGSLGWDLIAANLCQPGELAIVVNTGYFADCFIDCLEHYQVRTQSIAAAPGAVPSTADIVTAVKSAVDAGTPPKLLTLTHVDTSTGVATPVAEIAAAVKAVSPNTLIALDGVCAHGAEELQFDAWGIDAAMTGAQKAFGAPPGVSITMFSPRAIEIGTAQKSRSYYASISKWLPIMRAYEEGRGAYFSTPPVNVIMALNAALDVILGVNEDSDKAMAQRFAEHKKVSSAFKQSMAAIGVGTLASAHDSKNEAVTMTAVKLPEGLDVMKTVGAIGERGVVVAPGIHKEVKTTYFRVGHMGVSVWDAARGDGPRKDDVKVTIETLCDAFNAVGYAADKAVAVAKYNEVMGAQ